MYNCEKFNIELLYANHEELEQLYLIKTIHFQDESIF